MALEKDNIYEFGFGRTDKVSKSVNLLDEAVFSFIYGGLFKVLKSFIIIFSFIIFLENPESIKKQNTESCSSWTGT